MPTAIMIAAPASLATRWFFARRATSFPAAIETRVHALVITAMSRLDERESLIFLVPCAMPTPRLSRFDERARISMVTMCMDSIFGLGAAMCKSRRRRPRSTSDGSVPHRSIGGRTLPIILSDESPPSRREMEPCSFCLRWLHIDRGHRSLRLSDWIRFVLLFVLFCPTCYDLLEGGALAWPRRCIGLHRRLVRGQQGGRSTVFESVCHVLEHKHAVSYLCPLQHPAVAIDKSNRPSRRIVTNRPIDRRRQLARIPGALEKGDRAFPPI